jgi:hypothetical protein
MTIFVAPLPKAPLWSRKLAEEVTRGKPSDVAYPLS